MRFYSSKLVNAVLIAKIRKLFYIFPTIITDRWFSMEKKGTKNTKS